jgi:pimeloyl-ACP methyl ester carboxylesterase
MRITRLAGALAMTAVVAVTLSGCFPFDFLRGAPTESTPTGESVAPQLEPYYEQILHWESCGDAQCTTAVAPMDWANPSKETDIELALTRHVASGKRIGSLFVNPGGPGGSGFDFVHDASSLDFAVSENLQRSFDVIGWDPRGVGRSTPVTCLDDAGLDDYLFGIPEAEAESPEWVAEVTESAIEFGQACRDSTGDALGFMDTVSTTRDLDLLRALVGDTKLNFLGYSYGSKIATTYIDLYPAKVGRLVLDGALDPSLSDSEVLVTQTAGFEKSLRAYLTACPGLEGCPFTGDPDVDTKTIAAAFDRLNANPVEASDGRLLDGYVLDTATSAALYSEDSWPYLNDLYTEVADGETYTAFLLADFYYGREGGEYTDNSFESFIAVQCLDSAPVVDPTEVAALSAALVAAAPTFSRPTGLGDVLCANWPFPATGPAPAPASGQGADPVLVISTTGDPATPYEWGVALARQLANGRLVSFDGEGHTAYNKESQCVNSIVDDYLVSGQVPSGDTEC